MRSTTLILAAVTAGLTAGLFAGFAYAVMPGLKRSGDAALTCSALALLRSGRSSKPSPARPILR
ncbi:hypothetical protein ACFQZZ_31120 [Nocardia sp. GCM10030253]|uniref:hypothetical protein n=1 Tax=Nocardia sp. GCM10030253 TaxID=3273404 RepID=UPI0036292D35